MTQRIVPFLLLGVVGLLFWIYSADSPNTPDQPALSITPPSVANTAQTPAPVTPRATTSHIEPTGTPSRASASTDTAGKSAGKKAAELPDSLGIINTDALIAAAEKHPDDKVRLLALNRLLEEGVMPSQAWLENIIQNDPSDEMRAEAFRVLTESSDVDTATLGAISAAALSDPSETIRTRAQALLSDMAASAAQTVPDQEAANSVAR